MKCVSLCQNWSAYVVAAYVGTYVAEAYVEQPMSDIVILCRALYVDCLCELPM